MKKLIGCLVFLSSYAFSQQVVEFSYDEVNRQFQAQLAQIFQNFASQQQAQGNEVVITYYDNLGLPRVTIGTSKAPSYLNTLSDYKVKFMKDYQLPSTQNILYTSTQPLSSSFNP